MGTHHIMRTLWKNFLIENIHIYLGNLPYFLNIRTVRSKKIRVATFIRPVSKIGAKTIWLFDCLGQF